MSVKGTLVLAYLGEGMARAMVAEGVSERDSQYWHEGWKAVIDALTAGRSSAEQAARDVVCLSHVAQALMFTHKAEAIRHERQS
jgi:hypothetical protein